MCERFTEFPDRCVWDLSGYTVNQIALDYAVTLLIARPEGSFSVVIEQIIELREGETVNGINPEDVVSAAPLLAYLHKPVASLTAFRNGELRIAFANGAEIAVPKDEQYESWNSSGSGEIIRANRLCSPHPGSPW